ncbi:armadillo repeat-containing protein 6 homolog isoform X2 [Daktulosphaira vitifoliae]|uniref:armadillo repeat-containing protein 6 homolog isoform X2 n=1 Tax=Daktulosphaira vitifoliae TaxID=58002 RepID=UPI0021A9E000|nr:armadillo repeat-containing protein 6 homolog isoform X2 [Daktulosphaira vitifoliae]
MDQKTFDDAITETMELLDMSYSEALTDTINQFQQLGMDMSKIKIKLELADGPLPSALNKLKKSIEITHWNEIEINTIVDSLKTVEKECITNEGQRLSKFSGAFEIICSYLERLTDFNNDHKVQFIKTFEALLSGGKQLIYGKALDIMVDMLKKTEHEGILNALLSWFKVISVTEDEREELRIIGLSEILKNILLINSSNKEIISSTCQLIRAQIREDNCSGDFSNAGERSRLLACDVLEQLIIIMKDFILESEDVTSEIFFTLATIIVRFEFCRKFNESGGLTRIKLAMEYHTTVKLNTQSFRLLKSLAGDDLVKDDIRKHGLCIHILSALQRHINNKPLCIEAMKLITTLCLRSPQNSTELIGIGVAELIVQAMKVHSNDYKHQQHACTAIRNIVSRNRELASEFLTLNVESIIEKIIAQHKECEFEAKSALRDLGLEVKFKEQWTGKGQNLTQ